MDAVRVCVVMLTLVVHVEGDGYIGMVEGDWYIARKLSHVVSMQVPSCASISCCFSSSGTVDC